LAEVPVTQASLVKAFGVFKQGDIPVSYRGIGGRGWKWLKNNWLGLPVNP